MSLIRYFSLDNKLLSMTLFSIYIVVVQQSLLQVYTEQPFFVLFDGLCLSVGAILAGDDQA
jgi:hypothetical protein